MKIDLVSLRVWRTKNRLRPQNLGPNNAQNSYDFLDWANPTDDFQQVSVESSPQVHSLDNMPFTVDRYSTLLLFMPYSSSNQEFHY